MLFTHSRPFTDTQKHTFCKFHTVQSPQLTLHEFIAVKTISAPHYPATEEPLFGITIADVRQIAVTRFLTFLLTCLDCQKAGIYCRERLILWFLMTRTQIRAAELWQTPFYSFNRSNLMCGSIQPTSKNNKKIDFCHTFNSRPVQSMMWAQTCGRIHPQLSVYQQSAKSLIRPEFIDRAVSSCCPQWNVMIAS